MYQEILSEENIVTPNKKQADSWSLNKRRKYHAGKMSQEEISEIEEGIPGWLWDIKDQSAEAAIVKQELLEMAKNGETRPSSTSKNIKEKKYGLALHCYTSNSSSSYDSKFNSTIRSLRPDWFETVSEKAFKKKQRLLVMAKKSSSKPSRCSRYPEEKKYGLALYFYTRKTSSSYDADFDQKIRQLRPEWFITPSEKAFQKKQDLLAMAKKGLTKPSYTSKNYKEKRYGEILNSYIGKTSSSYDADFDQKIRQLRPDWFVTPSEKAFQKKQDLLAMAKKRLTRPSCTSKDTKEKRLGNALISYTNKHTSAYDSKFDQKIRRLRPDWFVTLSDKAAQIKLKLFARAKAGLSRPSEKTKDSEERKLGNALGNYTRQKSGSYDEDFDKKIRELKPDWFVTHFDKATEKKQILLTMAKKGLLKPSRKTKNAIEKTLSRALEIYTSKWSESYDSTFENEIYELRPDWFPKKGNKR